MTLDALLVASLENAISVSSATNLELISVSNAMNIIFRTGTSAKFAPNFVKNVPMVRPASSVSPAIN